MPGLFLIPEHDPAGDFPAIFLLFPLRRLDCRFTIYSFFCFPLCPLGGLPWNYLDFATSIFIFCGAFPLLGERRSKERGCVMPFFFRAFSGSCFSRCQLFLPYLFPVVPPYFTSLKGRFPVFEGRFSRSFFGKEGFPKKNHAPFTLLPAIRLQLQPEEITRLVQRYLQRLREEVSHQKS